MTRHSAQIDCKNLVTRLGRNLMTAVCVRRDKAAFLSGCESHPAISLQPEAIGAVMEVTKWLKPLV